MSEEDKLKARIKELERQMDVLRGVIEQLRQRLWILVETACSECKRREEKALKKILR